MTRVALLIVAGGLLLSIFAADPRIKPGASGNLMRTMDEQLAEISRQVPGFAGLHYDPDRAVVYLSLTDPAYQAEAEKAVAAMFGPEVLRSRSVVVQYVEYDFLQLQQWYGQLQGHMGTIKSLSWTDIDEKANRIRVGIGTVEGRDQLQAAIKRAGVPPQAVIIDLPEGALSEAN